MPISPSPLFIALLVVVAAQVQAATLPEAAKLAMGEAGSPRLVLGENPTIIRHPGLFRTADAEALSYFAKDASSTSFSRGWLSNDGKELRVRDANVLGDGSLALKIFHVSFTAPIARMGITVKSYPNGDVESVFRQTRKAGIFKSVTSMDAFVVRQFEGRSLRMTTRHQGSQGDFDINFSDKDNASRKIRFKRVNGVFEGQLDLGDLRIDGVIIDASIGESLSLIVYDPILDRFKRLVGPATADIKNRYTLTDLGMKEVNRMNLVARFEKLSGRIEAPTEASIPSGLRVESDESDVSR